jgi:hypothetical protein
LASKAARAQLAKLPQVSSTQPSFPLFLDKEDLTHKASRRKVWWTRWAWKWKMTNTVLNR